MTEAPENQQFEASQTANIRCAAIGYTPPVFRWFKNQEEVDSKKDPRSTIMKNGTLQIRKINESDSGDYVCRITQLSFLARTREEERKIKVVVFGESKLHFELELKLSLMFKSSLTKCKLFFLTNSLLQQISSLLNSSL